VTVQQGLRCPYYCRACDAGAGLQLGNDDGQARLYLGQYEGAVEMLRRSIEANGRYPLPYISLAAAYAHCGQQEPARKALRKHPRLNSESASVASVRDRCTARGTNPVFLEQIERHLIAGLRKAGLPE
jgi:lipopolysaccharide biosynthesis regulator YciM